MSETQSRQVAEVFHRCAKSMETTGAATLEERQRLKRLSHELQAVFRWSEPELKRIRHDIDQIEQLLFRVQQKYNAAAASFQQIADNITA